MKKFSYILALILIAYTSIANAQETIMDDINYNELEKYVQMAKEHFPQRKILNEQENIEKNLHTMANVSYLDLFTANYYYRPDEQEALNALNPYITNGFQFGINLNLGTFLQKPFQAKNARSNVKIAQLEKQILDTELEKEVKNRYYAYIQKLRELKLKTVDSQDVISTFQSITNRFEKGEITIEEYTTARAAVSAVSSTKIQTEIDYLRAKDDLEEIIGATLSNIR